MYCGRCGTWVPAGVAACARCGMPPSASAQVAASTPVTSEPPGIEAGACAETALRYGGFFRRLAAGLVDAAILFFPDAILRVLAGLPGPFVVRTLSEDEMGRSLWISFIMVIAWWWYCSRLESSRWQGTLGQQLFGLRVTDRTGRRITFLRASSRFFAQWLSVLLCGTGYLFNLWTSRRQTLHDLVAGCLVVRPQASALRRPALEPPPFAEQPS